jgi:predicted alpha/beta-fold hydrolase
MNTDNLLPVAYAAINLIGVIIAPFALVPLVFININQIFDPLLCTLALVFFGTYYINNYIRQPYLLRNENPKTKAGLYYCNTPYIHSLLKLCHSLTAKETKAGGLKGAPPCPWFMCGDMRTLFPFLAFAPKPLEFKRRWVRVPLADGSLDNVKTTKKEQEGEYEAVALDCAFASREGSDTKHNKYAYFVLAGLTGGSSEGYILDFVQSALQKGHDCFVMLGRGLGGTPCVSDAIFHGARTSDATACINAVRKSLSEDTKLFAVGFSMGGIIVTNAIARGAFDVDGGVSISGCFDSAANVCYDYSMDVWQPLLALGLKQNLIGAPGMLSKVRKFMGDKTEDKLVKCRTVVDFDREVVTAVHRFDDIFHYYSDMCGASVPTLKAMVESAEQEHIPGNHFTRSHNKNDQLPSFSKPLLAVHSKDDPIVHVDTMPVCHGLVEKIDNLVCLVTEKGGHVGWPVGLAPSSNRWLFSNTLIHEFCGAVVHESLLFEDEEPHTMR